MWTWCSKISTSRHEHGMYFCEFDPPNFSRTLRKLNGPCSNARAQSLAMLALFRSNWPVIKMFIFLQLLKVKMLALTKSENGHAHMLVSARTYPISVATLYVLCESVRIQKLLKVDLRRTDAFWATQLICSCTCYFTEMARKEFRPELAWHKQTDCSAG